MIDPSKPSVHPQDDQQSEALKTLDQLKSSTQGFADSALSLAARSVGAHFFAQDLEQKKCQAADKAEIWATRSARLMALLFVGYVLFELVGYLGSGLIK